MGLLDGKRLLITGVLTDASLAFAVARMAQDEGAEVVLSGAGRGLSLVDLRTGQSLEEAYLSITGARATDEPAPEDGALDGRRRSNRRGRR